MLQTSYLDKVFNRLSRGLIEIRRKALLKVLPRGVITFVKSRHITQIFEDKLWKF